MASGVSPALEIDSPDLIEAPASGDPATVVHHLAHELRQPLSAIESIAYYLSMVLRHDDSRVRVQAEKLGQLVHQMAAILSDAEHLLRAPPSRPQIMDLHELISELAAERTAAHRQPVTLALSPGASLVSIDPVQGRRMVRSLLSLAPPDSPLLVSTEVGAAEVAVEVRLGAPPSAGGLALAGIRSIATNHGGRLDVHATDSGAVLIVRLPRTA